MLGQLDLQPTIVFLLTMAFSIFLFAIVRLLMCTLYTRILCRWCYLIARVEKLAQNGAPLVKKYGTWGLVVFVALPVPGTGVVSGTILSWLMGLKWYTSFLAIIPASAVSNVLTTAGIMGLLYLS